MWDVVFRVLAGLILVFCGGQLAAFAGLIFWTIWTDSIKPRLISSAEVDQAADDIIGNYTDPEDEAFARHERAWYRSYGAEQTYWLRVRKAVRRRLQG